MYPEKAFVSIDGSRREEFELSSLSTFASLRSTIINAVKELRAPGGIPVKESKEKQDQAPAGKLLLDL